MISTVACDAENLGVITDYEVVSHLAHLTHKVTTINNISCVTYIVWQKQYVVKALVNQAYW